MHDCLVIGGGPAGLVAATYLGRFRRRVAIVDGGQSRLRKIAKSRNVPGFPEGISGLSLLSRLNEQALKYGVENIKGSVEALSLRPDGFAAVIGQRELLAKTVVLATGVDVVDPGINDIDAAVVRGAIRYCPICDSFEVIGKRLAVLGGRPRSIEEARFLRTYSDDVTFVPAQAHYRLHASDLTLAKSMGIRVTNAPISLALTGQGIRMTFEGAEPLLFDSVYPCLGVTPRSQLGKGLGVRTSRDGGILTDRHQMTSVKGLYSAGDVVEGLDQIASAFGQGAIAATAIHNRLR